jgi:predicted O-linked N-acetylglucosamine transferase (SPINDLY family)
MNQPIVSIETDFASKIQAAWRGALSLAELIDYGNRLTNAGLHELSVVLYQIWVEHNSTAYNNFALFNLGTAYDRMGRLEDAKRAYRSAIDLSPSFIQPHFNLGLVYERLKQPQAALAEWQWVANTLSVHDQEHASYRLMAMNNLARLFENERQYGDALDWLRKSLEVNPNQTDVLHHWVFLRAKMCEWPVYAVPPNVDPALMYQSTSALAMISQSDDPEAQLIAARHYVENKVNLNLPALSNGRAYGHEKLRIGYVSSDFSLHPVSMLMVQLFELHDREHFEVFGYCWSPEDGSVLRQRVINAMDHFQRIDQMSDADVARLIREQEIDILVDLQGQTFGARPDIFAARPAPVQITYLGLPATTGFPFIDYVIADEYLIPPEFAPYYSEKPLYMPDIYQVSDRKRVIAEAPSRESLGLPAEGLVFCSFNNNYKFTPQMFDIWMNVLKRVPGSVLWLLSDNRWAEANLRKEAELRGVDGQRLVFAVRTWPEMFLARLSVADLFLDSFPFNAGTTANDALWAGLPLVTCSGRSFAARMAGALLTAAGLSELITTDLGDYEEKVVALALAPQELLRLRAVLAQAKETGALFDTPAFARNLEQRFKELVGALNG